MTDDATLHDNAAGLLRSGRLPGYRPQRLWGGPASGRERCLVCGEPIRAGEIILEADFGGPTTDSFHVNCFAVLELEGNRLQNQRPPTAHRHAMART